MKSHRFTSVEISVPDHLIGPTDEIVTMGSCFAENIGQRLLAAKVSTLANPLGILYNPVSLGKVFGNIKAGLEVQAADCDVRADIYFHYDYHSKVSALAPETVATTINTKLRQAEDHLKGSRFILLTLGTSFVYERRDSGAVVANCHKMPAALFDKRLLSVDESLAALLSTLPQDKQIIVTVSPVRHTKEGLVANQRSKSRLIEVAHLLAEEHKHCTYFPAYELLVDELRDYRYYESDLIHPTAEAVDMVWAKFKETFFSAAAQQRINAIEKLQLSLEHRPLVADSSGHRRFVQELLSKIDSLSCLYPDLDFTKEVALLRGKPQH